MSKTILHYHLITNNKFDDFYNDYLKNHEKCFNLYNFEFLITIIFCLEDIFYS